MTEAERWEAWQQATPKQQAAIVAWFIGVCGDDFDRAVRFARSGTAEGTTR